MIVKYPNPVLKKECQKIKRGNKELSKVLNLLEKELSTAEIGVGLSAPQVRISLAVFAIKKGKIIKFFLNPEIVDTFGGEKVYSFLIRKNEQKKHLLEGCLSFPKIYGTVKRWLKIKVKFQARNFKKVEKIFTGFEAIVFQHEFDHLNGIVFIDRIKAEGGKIYREENGKLEKIKAKDL